MLCVLGCSSDQSFPQMVKDPKYFQKFGPPLQAVHDAGITGSGINIAIIDTFDSRYLKDGIVKEHFALKIPPLKIKSKKSPSDHALMCTAIVVGQRFDGYRDDGSREVTCSYPGGVAPGANATLFLVNLGDHRSLRKAFKKVAKRDFHVVSLSFGGPAKWMEKYIKRIQEKNTIVVAAAGNGGNWEGVLEPASFKDVISVGSLDTFLNKSKSSPKGDDVDIYFHGEIMVPISDSSKKKLKFSQGTSMATPGIAGLICLLLQCTKKHDYDIKKIEILLILKKMFTTITTEHGIVYDHKPIKDYLIKAYKDRNFIHTICHY